MTVYDKMTNGEYDNKKSFPSCKDKSEEAAQQRKEYKKEERRLIQQFKKDLEKENNVFDNSKKEVLWRLAWHYGHSSGLAEISFYWLDMVKLIK